MNATQTHSATETAFNGPLSPTVTAFLAIALCVVFAWSLYRERLVLGKRATLGFAALRFICLASILWMLLSPTSIVVETLTTKRSIAFITDNSASMGTVDPVGTSDESRWQSASNESEPDDASSCADRALCAMGIAGQELGAAIDGIKNHKSDDQISSRIKASQQAIKRVIKNIDLIRNQPLSDSTPAGTRNEFEPLLSNAWRLLKSPEFEEFAALERKLASGRSPTNSDWREGLSDLQYRVRTTRQVLQEISRVLAESSHLDANFAADMPRQATRMDRVTRLLKSLQANSLEELSESCDIRWTQFNTLSENVQDPSMLQVNFQADSSNDNENSTDGLATNLSAALESLRVTEGQLPLAAAFVFTDAAHNDTGARSDEDGMPVQGDPSESPITVAKRLDGTPVYVVPIGNARRLRDLNLVGVDAPAVAMRNDDIVIEAHLEAYQCENERCSVKLVEDGEVVDFREIEFDSDFASRTIRFQRRVSEVGEASLSVIVDALEGEMTEENNLRKVSINVTRNQIKVLLADEMPRWEFRYLAQLFRRDPKIECDEMLFRPRLIATGNRQQSKTFPTTADQWDEYDVVVLGDLPPRHFPVAAQESLKEYLTRRGGTAILIAGRRAMPDAFQDTPLMDLLPVTRVDSAAAAPNGYAFQATRAGRSHVALMIGETQQSTQTAWDFINRFSPLEEVSPWRRPKPSAKNLISVVRRDTGLRETVSRDVVLGDDAVPGDDVVPGDTKQQSSTANQETFLCWQPIGRGRMVYLSGPETYRLRFLRGDRYHYRFWGQMLRWAIASELDSGSRQVRLRSEKTDFRTGQDVAIEVRLAEEDGSPLIDAKDVMLQVKSTHADQRISLVNDEEVPGLYHGVVNAPPPGVYRVQPVGGFVDSLPSSQTNEDFGISFTVRSELPLELADTRSNRVLASQISQLTGGQVLPPTAITEVLRLSDLSPIVTQSIQQTPLWAQWKYLWLVFGCLQVEWTVRKWRGLS